MKRTAQLSLVFLSSVAVFGCDDGGDDTFSTGVEGSKSVDMLTDSELQQVCDAGHQFVKDFIEDGSYQELVCRAAGLFAVEESQLTNEQKRSLCKAAYDLCRDNVQITVGPPDMCMRPPGCMATVGQIEQCLNDEAAALSSSAADLPTCDSADFDTLDLSNFDDMFETAPTSCVTVEAQCPGGSDLVDPDVDVGGLDIFD